jgi:hypothetical protein
MIAEAVQIVQNVQAVQTVSEIKLACRAACYFHEARNLVMRSPDL